MNPPLPETGRIAVVDPELAGRMRALAPEFADRIFESPDVPEDRGYLIDLDFANALTDELGNIVLEGEADYVLEGFGPPRC